MTDAEYAALEVVSERRVKATVSFLASDELGGRGTPSKEFNIASAYVASRLLAAGAEGLGPDGSFYLKTEIETTRVPDTGSMIMVGGKPVKHSVFASDSEGLEFKGQLATFVAGSQEEFTGPVLFKPEGDELASANFMRSIQGLVQAAAAQDATALVIVVPAEHPLWEAARVRQTLPQVDRRGGRGVSLPIVLVEDWESTPDEEVLMTVPATIQETAEVQNTVGVIRGSDPELADQAIVFSAHLDHLGRGAPGDDPIYNGADDDASGVTAVLTLADAFGALEKKPARSVIFLTFWGEERGLLGSRKFVEDSPWPLEDIAANINIEMIGRPAADARNKMWLTGWHKSDLGEILAAGSRRIGVVTFEHPQYSEMLYQRSDNWAFAQEGVVAHSVSAGSLHDDYHQPSDEWEKLDLEHMTQIIRGIFAAALPIANDQATPKGTE